MIGHQLISVDIGSTWTKAAKFNLEADRFVIAGRSAVPTTVEFLPNGFYAALNQLESAYDWSALDSAPMPVYFSSSAKGGLKVAVVGLVPEMSMQIARLAACSAGARVCAAFSYRLTRSCLKNIEQIQPDILLLCGGTDGGNERYPCENAKALSATDYNGTIIFAGNNCAADTVAEILAGRDLRIAENVMPDFGRLNIEPARGAIREVFLDRIVSGKGLDRLVAQFGVEPVPTPLAVYNLVDAVGQNCEDWQNFALIDMGGATTDFYSCTNSYHADSGTVLKGIQEPRLKRTVEGDLGMRVSARSVLEIREKEIRQRLSQLNIGFEEIAGFVDRLEMKTSYVPGANDKLEQIFDEILAQTCVDLAITRHSGTMEEVYTTTGPVWAQHGKDLRKIDKIVGSGGYLAANARNNGVFNLSLSEFDENGRIILAPHKFNFYADASYLWPLLGNLALEFPAQAAATAVSVLQPDEKSVENNHPIDAEKASLDMVQCL